MYVHAQMPKDISLKEESWSQEWSAVPTDIIIDVNETRYMAYKVIIRWRKHSY